MGVLPPPPPSPPPLTSGMNMRSARRGVGLPVMGEAPEDVPTGTSRMPMAWVKMRGMWRDQSRAPDRRGIRGVEGEAAPQASASDKVCGGGTPLGRG